MTKTLAGLACALGLVSAPSSPPSSPPSSAAPLSPPSATSSVLPVWYRGGPLQVLPDGRVAPLDSPQRTILGDAKAGPALVERVDLVWGCRGDRARAQLLEGEHRLTTATLDACAVRVDVRPPCAPEDDVEGMAEPDERAILEAAAAAHQLALAKQRRVSAQLAAGFSGWGPGLRLVVSGGGTLWLSASRLAVDGCDCEAAQARAIAEEVRSIVLPRLAAPTVVWLAVPRYQGALYRLGAQRPPAIGALAFVEPFSILEGAADVGDGAPALREAFSAPAGCDCAPCDVLE